MNSSILSLSILLLISFLFLSSTFPVSANHVNVDVDVSVESRHSHLRRHRAHQREYENENAELDMANMFKPNPVPSTARPNEPVIPGREPAKVPLGSAKPKFGSASEGIALMRKRNLASEAYGHQQTGPVIEGGLPLAGPVAKSVPRENAQIFSRNPFRKSPNGNDIAMMSPSKLIATQDSFGNQNVEAQMAGARRKAAEAHPNSPPAEALKLYFQETLFNADKGKTVPVWIDPLGGVHLVDAHHRAQQALKAGVDVPVEIINDFRGFTFKNGEQMTQGNYEKSMFRGEKGNLIGEKQAIYARSLELKRQGVKEPLAAAVQEFHAKKEAIRSFPTLGDNPTRSAMGTVFHENRLNADLFKDYKQFDVQPWLEKQGTSLRKIADGIEAKTPGGKKIDLPETNPQVIFELRGMLLQDKAIKEITSTRLRGDMQLGKLDQKLKTLNEPTTQTYLQGLKVIDAGKIIDSPISITNIVSQLKLSGKTILPDYYKDPNVIKEVKSQIEHIQDKNMAMKKVYVDGLIRNSKDIYHSEKVLRDYGVDGGLFQSVSLINGQVDGINRLQQNYETVKGTKLPGDQKIMTVSWSEWTSKMAASAKLEKQAMAIPSME